MNKVKELQKQHERAIAPKKSHRECGKIVQYTERLRANTLVIKKRACNTYIGSKTSKRKVRKKAKLNGKNKNQ